MEPELIAFLAACNKDPIAFVMGAFPWGEAGTSLEGFAGPDPWQLSILQDIKSGLIDLNTAIQLATASGHGIGKSCLVAWIILWAFTTAPDTRGYVTANTENQLKTKTWSELGKWFNLFLGRNHFTLTATALLSKDPDRERTWRFDMIPWSEKNPEAFAGMHNKGKRILVIMDEASAIIDIIWETIEGALTDSDTEILWLAFGNPTRPIGRFRECFDGGTHHSTWHCRQIDSRSVAITNKTQIAKWQQTYGEDSDFFRVRVLGVFPKHGLMEFFSAAEVEGAMARDVAISKSDPLALGVDVARFGANNTVLFARKGRDARTIERQQYNGLDTVAVATKVFDFHHQYHPTGIMIDGGGVGGGVVDNVRRMQLFCYEIQFGAKPDQYGGTWNTQGERYANKRAEMYGACRAWLPGGAIPNDPALKSAMLAIRYSFNKRDEIQLESKEDILAEHPELDLDSLDGLCLTFGVPLANHADAGGDYPQPPVVEAEYDPFASERMVA